VNFFLSVQKTDYSGMIRKTLQDEGLAGAVQKLPLERKFKLETVREVRPSLLEASPASEFTEVSLATGDIRCRQRNVQ
jgi:hypothetical protein